MDLEIVTSGKKFFKIDGGVGALLLELFSDDVLRRVDLAAPQAAPARPRQPDWKVTTQETTGKPLIQLVTPLGEVCLYDGPAAGAAAAFKQSGWSVPETVVQNYAAQLVLDSEQRSAAMLNAQKRGLV